VATFDDELKARLAAFQKANGLTSDGVADTKTWELLASPAPAKTEQSVPKQAGPLLTKDQFPLTYELASMPATTDGILDFLAAHGCDVRAVLADMDRILAATPTN
jgi:hypothetical protein